MTTHRIVLLTSLVSLLPQRSPAQALHPAGATRVEGSVADYTGTPVPNARVRAWKLGPRLAGEPARRYEALTAGTGAYSVAGLPAGQYRICVQVSGQEILDPCLWAQAAPVTVITGQSVAGPAIRLPRPMPVSIRVDDPGNVLAAARAGGSHVLVGVWSANGLFHPARLAAQDAAGRTYSAIVPAGRPARITVDGHNVRIRDNAGRALPRGGAVDVDLPAAAAAPHRLAFQVAAP